MFQLQVGLFESGVIKMWGRISVRVLLFEARYVISDLVIVGADPLQMNAKGRVNKNSAKETAKQMSNSCSLSCV